MLLLLFRVIDQRYALAARRVVEVVPRVDLRPIPHAPEFLAGLFNYRGRAVPVVDLGRLLGASSSLDRLDTRIILAREPGECGGRLLGLVAEHVSEVATVRDDQVVLPGMSLEDAPYLGEVVRTEAGLVQVIAVEKVLSESLRNAIFGHSTEVP
jgi:chemotaxis-related protein WspB